MKHLRWLLVALAATAVLMGCNDNKNSGDKTPAPGVEVAPSATSSVTMPDVQTGEGGNTQVSPLATPNTSSPLPTPTATPKA